MTAAVARPAKVATDFTVVVPAKRKFTGTMLVQPGTLTATLKLGGRSWTSKSSCTDRLGGPLWFALWNSCGKRLMVANRGSGPVRIRYRAYSGCSSSSDPLFGSFSVIASRGKGR